MVFKKETKIENIFALCRYGGGMAVNLADVVEKVFGKRKTIKISDERWKQVAKNWRVIRQQDSEVGLEKLASDEDLNKRCTF